MYHIEQVSKSEYERQKDLTTKNEIEKLLNSKEYLTMKSQKGDQAENWNW